MHLLEQTVHKNLPMTKLFQKKSAHKYRTVKKKAKDARARVRNNRILKLNNLKRMEAKLAMEKQQHATEDGGLKSGITPPPTIKVISHKPAIIPR